MKTYLNPASSEWNSLIARPSFPAENLDEKVRGIIAKVQNEGDAALRQFSKEFDKVELTDLKVLSAEIEFAKTYCELLKTRFEDSVSFDFMVNEAALKSYVVPLSLQLLLENCIKHNFATSSKPLHIKIFYGKRISFDRE